MTDVRPGEGFSPPIAWRLKAWPGRAWTAATSFVAAFALAMSLAALVGAFWSPLTLLADLTPVWLVVAGAGWLGGRGREPGRAFRRGAAALCGICALALIGGEAVKGLRPLAPAGAAEDRLRLVQFNVWGRNIDQDATLAWILRQQADVVVIEEGYGDSWRLNKRLRQRYPYWSSCNPHKPCSVTVFSRWRPLAQDGRAYPRSAWMQIDWRGEPVTVVGAHYPWPYPLGADRRRVPTPAPRLSQREQAGLIIVGDFNATPWSAAARLLHRKFGIERRSAFHATWPVRLSIFGKDVGAAPFLPLDHIYAGKTWRVARLERGPRLGSDHLPLIVEFVRR